MSHGLLDVTLQSTRHEVILRGLLEVTSECQEILHEPSVTPMVLMVQNGRKCITYIYYKIKHRVGSHVVSVRIHCTEKWRTSFHTDVLSKSKWIFLRVFSSLHRKLYTIFQPPFFPIERCQDILIKLLTLSTDSVTSFLAAKIGPEFGNKLYGQHL